MKPLFSAETESGKSGADSDGLFAIIGMAFLRRKECF
jgi:hypothetical protein